MFERPSPPPIDTDIVIIGAGVAGIAAAKEFLEADIDFWLLGSPYESQLAKAGELRDVSLPDGTIGLKHIETEIEELKENGINHRSSLCTGIEPLDVGFKVKTKFQDFETQNILIAIGNKQKTVGFDGEEDFFRKGISDCTVCDYPLYRDKPVAVLGNHEYTIRAAQLMRKHTDNVSLLWYKNDDAPELEGITSYNNVSDLEARGEDSLSSLKFNCSNGNMKLEIDGLFVEGKPVPKIDFLENFSLDTHNGHLVVDDEFETSKPSIWAAGDIIGEPKNYDQATKEGKLVAEIILKSLS